MRELTVRESGGAVETTEHFWRGATLTAERFSDGTLHEYVYGPGGLPLELVVRAPGQPAERYSYAVDGGGSVIGLVGDDAYSGLVASYRYGPYGEVEETWAASGHEDLAWRNPLRYRAYCHDAATGLYYMPARYYDPETMRFLSPDPASPSAGEPLSLNRYAYCVGDPVNKSDPSGARHEAGGGSSRVAEEAIDLAREGRLEEAKEVQAAYRRAVSGAYAGGATYGDAHKDGREAATRSEAAARSSAEQSAPMSTRVSADDGTPYGRFNLTLMPTQPDNATWCLCLTGFVGDCTGPVGQYTSLFIDLFFAGFYYGPQWTEGKTTLGNAVFTALAAAPTLSTVSTVVYAGGYELIPWAEPREADQRVPED